MTIYLLSPYYKISKEYALELYLFYIKINESLYLPLQIVELLVKEKFYDSIAEKYGENWLLNKKYILKGRNKMEDTAEKKIDKLLKQNPSYTNDNIKK